MSTITGTTSQNSRSLQRLRYLLRWATGSSEQRAELAAKTLHNEAQSFLVAAQFDLTWLKSRAAKMSAEDIANRCERIASSLDQAIKINRNVEDLLRPNMVHHLGLAVAMQRLLSTRVPGTTLRVEERDTVTGAWPLVVSIKAYRIAEHSLAWILDRQVLSLDVSLKMGEAFADLNFLAKVQQDTIPDSNDPRRTALQVDHEELRGIGGFVRLSDRVSGERSVTTRIPASTDISL